MDNGLKKVENGTIKRKIIIILILLIAGVLAGAGYYYYKLYGRASKQEVADLLSNALKKHQGNVCVMAPKGDSSMPGQALKMKKAGAVPGLVQALDGPDQAKIADILRKSGLNGILVSRKFHFRDRRPDAVLNRFIRLRFCRLFNAELMAEDWVLYSLVKPLEYSRAEKKALLELARKALSREKTPELSFLPASLKARKNIETEVILTIWPNHRFAVMARAKLKGPIRAVLKAASRCKVKWARRQKTRGLPLLEMAMPKSRIQIDIVHDRGRFVDRTDKVLFYGVELGLAGLYLKKDDRIKVLPPGYAVWFGKDYYTKLLKSLMLVSCGRGKTESSKKCRNDWSYKDPKVDFGRFAAVSFRDREPGGGLIELYRSVPLIKMSDITRESIIKAVEAGADNMAKTVYPNGELWPHGHKQEAKLKPEPGKVVYRYAPITDYYSRDYNMVRHVLVPYTVMLANRFVPKELYRKAALASMRFFQRHCRFEKGMAYPFWNNNVKTGAAALGAVALMEYASQAELPPDLRKLAKGLEKFILFMEDKNGHFKDYHVKPGHPYYGRETTIFPGEILLGLSRLYRVFKDQEAKQGFEKGAEFYHKYFETAASRKKSDGTYSEGDALDILQFSPWYIMALEDFYRQSKDPKYAKWALEVGNWAVDNYEVLPPRAPYADHVGTFWQREREEPAMHGCVYTEGAASALGVATAAGNELMRNKFRNATLWGCRFALQLQYHHLENDFYLPFPKKADGAFRYSLTEDHIRIDYTYHALSALTQALKHLKEDEFTIVRPEPDVNVKPAFPVE
ncbi:MAG: hypothetical protein GXP49_15590 [Deltaproteobacteria bacterium]|nr:hypothetical protein [Deltaproteobacteria bacterium]